MKATTSTRWAVCVDGSPVVLRRGKRAALRSLGEFRRALPDLGGMSVERVQGRVQGDFVLYERCQS